MPSPNVLVVGGSGFLGQSLVLCLFQTGIRFSYTYRNCTRSTNLVCSDRAFYFDVESSDISFLSHSEYTHVICLLPIANSLPLINSAPLFPSIAFIFLSTTAIYTGFDSPYRAARLHAENLLLQNCPSCVIIRPTMIVGSLTNDTVGKLLVRFSSQGFGFLPRPFFGSCFFQPIDVYDLSRLIVSFVRIPLPSSALPHVCDVGGSKPVSFFRYFRFAAEIFDFKLIVLPLPFCLLLPALRLLGSFGLKNAIYLHEKLYRLQEAKVVPNRIHPLIKFSPGSYWSSLAHLRIEYFLRNPIA